MNLSPQARLVLDYLKSGRTLTVQIALNSLRVHALPRRIKDIKEWFATLQPGDEFHGHTIGHANKKDHWGARYVSYSLKAPKADASA